MKVEKMQKKATILSYNTLCMEIGGSESRKKFATENKKVDSSSSPLITIKGVYFDDLDYVPFNPSLDPDYGSCFNCWRKGHTRKECTEEKHQDFCHNCGRRDVRTTSCPRCSRAYVSYWKKMRKESKSHSCEFYDAKYFEKEQTVKENREPESFAKSFGIDNERVSSSESGYFEEMIVDEDKRSPEFTGKFLEDFLNLMEAMKHLPIDVQNTVILRFVEDRRKLVEENDTMIITIPSLSKLWDSCKFLVASIYKFVQDILSNFRQLKT